MKCFKAIDHHRGVFVTLKDYHDLIRDNAFRRLNRVNQDSESENEMSRQSSFRSMNSNVSSNLSSFKEQFDASLNDLVLDKLYKDVLVE